MANVLGIDLGLTNARCATLASGDPVLVRNDRGEIATPAVIGLDKGGALRVGEPARNQLLLAPDRTAAGFRRLMGTRETVPLGERRYSPTEITGILLRRLREDAERAIGTKVTAAAIGVPAYFTDAQRQATRDAAALASLGSVALCSEPMAVALAYGLWSTPKGHHSLIFDLGGASLDVSIVEGGGEGPRLLAAAGQVRLGGDDFDKRLLKYLLEQFERSYGFSVEEDPRSLLRLRLAAEKAKRDLSTRDGVTVSVAGLGTINGAPLHLETELSREQMQLLIEDLCHKALEQVDIALRDARLDVRAIDEVLLSGGGAQVPFVRQLLAEKLGREPRGGVQPVEAIARGAALFIGKLGLGRSGEPLRPPREPAALPVPPLDGLGPTLHRDDEEEQTDRFQRAEPAGRARASGGLAGASGGVGRRRASREPVTCPATVGIEVATQRGGRRVPGGFSPVLRRGDLAPVARTVLYHTTTEQQTEMDIRVYEGEAPLTRDNRFLGLYTVRNLPPGPAGGERVLVTFQCSEDGELSLKVRVLSTGQEDAVSLSALGEPPPRARSGRAALPPPGPAEDLGFGEEAPSRAVSGGFGEAPAVSSADEVLGRYRSLVAAAERKAGRAHPQVRVKLQYLSRRLKEAVVLGDRADAERLAEALENALFALNLD